VSSLRITDVWLLRGFRWIYIAFIAQATLKTLHGAGEADVAALLALAGVELVAICAFLIEPVELVACAVLLAVYAIASGLTLMQGEAPLRFFYYAVTAALIVRPGGRRRTANNILLFREVSEVPLTIGGTSIGASRSDSGGAPKGVQTMKKTLLAAGVALGVLAGGVGTASADVGFYVGVNDRDGYYRHHHHHHYWWRGRWYDYQPSGYYYMSPPYPYYHSYWRRHWRQSYHCRDWDRDGDCD
jgi:hypothetical protein